MENRWIATKIDINTVNWKGKPIQVTGVKALKNSRTGSILVYPFEVARAEVKQMADCFGILPRDLAAFLMIYAHPKYFKEGEVFYKYHLQKLLFYFWKCLESQGYAESFPVDNFIAADNGPKPKHLNKDLERLVKKKLITVRREKTEQGTESKRIMLTKEGLIMAEELWNTLPDPYIRFAVKMKERIHPLTPERVRHLVHNEYPEYKDTYVKNDME